MNSLLSRANAEGPDLLGPLTDGSPSVVLDAAGITVASTPVAVHHVNGVGNVAVLGAVAVDS